MPTKRIKATSFATRLDFEIAVDRIAFASTEVPALEAARDHAVQQLISETDAHIALLEEEIKTKAARCHKYAKEHRAELLPDEEKSKSAHTALTTYGFRLGQPTLKPLPKWNWEKVLAAVVKRFGCDDKRIRVKREVDKERLLSEYKKKKKIGRDTTLDQLGLKHVQAETFFIEPKAQSAATVKAGGAS